VRPLSGSRAESNFSSVISKIAASIATMTLMFASSVLADGTGGWRELFNGEDFTGWQVSEAAAESWSVIDGVIDCDPRSVLPGTKHVWTEDAFGDFVLYVEWRFTDAPTTERRPLIGPDGNNKVDDEGRTKTVEIENADSGIFLRGQPKAQVNIWNWPVGSGEVWGYRTDSNMPPEVRAGVTPRVRADNPVGEWNTYVISMSGDRLSVILNGQLVIDDAQLPGVAASGPLGLQYHGGYDHERNEYRPASSLVQFRNLYIKELD